MEIIDRLEVVAYLLPLLKSKCIAFNMTSDIEIVAVEVTVQLEQFLSPVLISIQKLLHFAAFCLY